MPENADIQFDGAQLILGGINTAEALQTDKNIIFNESYVVLGKALRANTIYATYDLTVIGDVIADRLEVNGELLVKGNIKARVVRCLRLTCLGKVNVDNLQCDEDVVGKIITADQIQAQGSIIVSDALNVNEYCEVERNVIAGEGVSGQGELDAKNVIVGDFFDFDGSTVASVYEISTMMLKKDIVNKERKESNGAEFDRMLEDFLTNFVSAIIDQEEDAIVEEIRKCAKVQRISFNEMYYLFCEIVRISYLNEVDNYRDYLLIKYAEKMFPRKFKEYETISHVFTYLLDESNSSDLNYSAKNLTEFMMSLRIITTLFENNDDEPADKIFSFIGLKYGFVTKQFEKENT